MTAVKRASEAQIPSVLELIQNSFADMAGRVDPPSSMMNLTQDQLERRQMLGQVWVVGDPVEACMVITPRPTALYLGKIAVIDSMRGQGHLHKLIAMAERLALRSGVNSLELETRIELTDVHAAFEATGFEKVGEGAHDGFDQPTYIIMKKALG